MTRLKGHDKVEGTRQGGRGMTRWEGHDKVEGTRQVEGA